MNDKGQHKDIKDSVLARLETEDIRPTSRWYWLTQEYGLWIIWFISVALGALSVAVIMFLSIYIGYSFYEATHRNFLTFLMETVPYLWLLAFLALIVVAYINVRYTRRGYRYPFILVIGSSFGFSVLGGMFLHYLGAGYQLDRLLGEYVPAYQSRAEFELVSWQDPADGRLVGTARVPDESGAIQGVIFTDIRAHEWQLSTPDLRERDNRLLRSGERVRVLMATSSDTGGDIFVVCGVFPWMADTAPAISRLRADRTFFIESVRERQERIRGVIKQVEQGIKGERPAVPSPDLAMASGTALSFDTDSGQPSPCGKLPLFMGSGDGDVFPGSG